MLDVKSHKQLFLLETNCNKYLDKISSVLLTDEQYQEKILCETNLYEFFKKSWHVLEPGKQLLTNWHQELICEYLEYLNQGYIKRLLINIAPRHLKSIIATINFPVWEWAKIPEFRYMCLSYSSRLSIKHNLKRRTLIQSRWFKSLWGDSFKLAYDNNLKTEFSNDHQGQMFASSFGGTITGEGGDRIIVDDPHNPNEIESDKVRASSVDEFDDITGTRLNDPNSGAIIVIKQRLHEQDISGHILADIGDYTHLCLPTECEYPQKIIFPISNRIVVRNVGDLLHPERFGAAQVAKAKKVLGAYKYAGRHQQRPVPSSGGIIDREWIKRYYVLPPLKSITQSWDTAQKDNNDNASWALTVWGESFEGNYYLLYSFTKRMNYVEGKKKFVEFYEAFQPDVILIEDKSTGSTLIQECESPIILSSREIKINAYIVPIMPKGDKVTRMEVEATAYELGRVHHPVTADWLADYETALFTFPKGIKDPIDSTSQFLMYKRKHTPNKGGGLSAGTDRNSTDEILSALTMIDQFGSIY